MTYQFWMNNLLILLLSLYPALSEAKSPAKAIKVVPYSTTQVTKGTRYKLNKTPSDLKITLTPNLKHKTGLSLLKKTCASLGLTCQIYPSAQKQSIINIYTLGTRSNLDKFQSFLKSNSLDYKILN